MKTLLELRRQLEENKQHQRHRTYRETMYWCRQWRLLAEELATYLPEPLSIYRRTMEQDNDDWVYTDEHGDVWSLSPTGMPDCPFVIRLVRRR